MNLKELMNKIVDFGLKNKLINTSVGCSSLYQINFEDIEDYPLLVFQPSSPHRVSQNFVEYTITLYWIDRLNSDNSNEFDIFSTSVENLKGIIKGMRNIKGIVDVSTDFDIVNFTDTQRLSDKCAGAYVTLKIDVLNENSCSLSNLEEEENEIKLKNQIKYIKIDRNGEYIITYDEGYNGLKEVEIDVELDTSIYVEEGYNQGKNVGIEEGKQLQKELLKPITITENGSYNREDGYNEIVVEVPDLNGDYDTGYNEGYNVGDVEGYDRGKTDGYNEGYSIGYNEGEENGVANAGEIIAQTARVLDITENGTYPSQYSDPVYPDIITGAYPDGENFYNYAQLNGVVFDTGVASTQDVKYEFWWKPDEGFNMFHTILGLQVDGGMIMKICETYSANELRYEYGLNAENNGSFTINDGWNHIIFSKADGLIVNGVKIVDLTANWYGDVYPNVFINASYRNEINSNANGYFGMIKITTNGVENIIIPTQDGFKNVTTNQTLQILKNGGYNFTEELPIIQEGNLIKTVNVNVQPKVDIAEIGLKFGWSTFKEMPEIFDFSNVTDMSDMFKNTQLNTLKGIDFSNIQYMNGAFYACGNLTNLDYFTPSKSLLYMNNAFDSCGSLRIIPNLDLSSVLDASSLFESCGSIEEIGDINFENATSIGSFLKNYGDEHPIRKIGVFNVPNLENIGDFFYYGFSPVIRGNLTEMGGFIGLKCNWDGGCGLDSCPNLTYQSCINILNGLADVTELGGRTLKVHPNFLTAVGDEISIAIAKNWVITT